MVTQRYLKHRRSLVRDALERPGPEAAEEDADEETGEPPPPPPSEGVGLGVGASRTPQQEQDDLLDIEDVVGRRVIATRLMINVTIGEEHATAALEVLTRFAADVTGPWERLSTSWLLDAELMPWSAKAQGLLRRQYAAVGMA